MRKLIPVLITLLVPYLSGYGQDIAQADGRLIPVNGTELFVKAIGKGEPIVIIHGGPVLDHSYLYPHLKSLANNYRLIFYDQRLSGRSSANADSADVRLNTFVEDIEALRNVLNLGEVHVLGHSWGGLLAMKYAIGYPSHTKSLMLISSMAPTSELWHKEEAVIAKKSTSEDSLARQKIMQSDLFRENPPEAIEQLLQLSFRKQFYNTDYADSLNLYVPDDYMSRSRLFGNLMPDITDYDLTEELKQMNVPTLILYGSSEPAADLSGPLLNKLITDSKYVIIEESGHFPFIEQPVRFKENILDFLETTSDKYRE